MEHAQSCFLGSILLFGFKWLNCFIKPSRIPYKHAKELRYIAGDDRSYKITNYRVLSILNKNGSK